MNMRSHKNTKPVTRKKIRPIDTEDGFTLIEILVVIGIIAILATVVLVAVNPARQFKLARDSQRTSNVTAILNAVGQNISEHKGAFYCNGAPMYIQAGQTRIQSGGSADLASCLVPDYMSSMPFDPSDASAFYSDSSSYDTGYSINQDSNGRITVSAVGELTTAISVTR